MARTGPKPKPIAERIAARLQVAASGCIEWQGTIRNGYGVMNVGSRADGTRRVARVHRLVFELAHGPIPTGLFVCHSCDNPICCNLDHLFLGTPADNTADMDAKGRRVNCPHRGEANGRARLTADDVRLIRYMASLGEGHLSLAARFGVSRTAIRDAIVGNTWAEVA